jgi:formylglycine-generating enzyme required for sulfatase activity
MTNQNAVFQRLRALSLEQFEVVLGQLGATDLIPPGALDVRRMALADWVTRHGRQADCLAAIRRVAPTAAADPAAWQQHRRARYGRVTAIGLHDGHTKRDLVLDHLFVALDIDWVEHHRVKRHRVGLKQREALGAVKDLTGALAALRRVRQAQATRGLVLIGPPGSGKTTLLRHQFCADVTNSVVYLRCSATKGQRFTRVAQWAEHEAALDGFVGAGDASLADPAAPFTFLLDGFDEIADPEERRALADWLAEEIERWPNAEWVLATRGAAWHQRAEHHALDRWLEPFEVLGLTDAAMAELAQRWFQASEALHRHLRDEATADARVAEQTAGLLYAIRKDQADAGLRLYDLATNPLLLTILCVVFQAQEPGHRRLPRRRGDLYQRCFEVLANRREDLPGFIPAQDLSRLLQPLAWALQRQDGAGGRELPGAEVEDLLTDGALRIRGLTGRAGPELRSYVVERTGLLYDPDGAQLGFIHQTFQEHLASLYADDPNKDRVEQVVADAHHGRWREPILLGQQRPAFHARFWDAVLTTPGRAAALRDLLVACALEEEPDHDAIERHLRTLSAADAEVVLGLLAGPPDRLLRLVPSLEGWLQHDDARVRRRVAELLGRDAPATVRRVRVAALDMEFVWVPPGSFLMGATREQGAPGFDPDAHPDEGPPHRVAFPEGFWIGRFPVTNTQYRRFVAEGGEPPGSFRRDRFNHPDQPVTEVSWHQAAAFAAWARRTLHLDADLPTEAEWEYAARGPDGRRYPWIGIPSHARASFDSGTDTPKAPPRVGERPDGVAWCAAEEMAGTVWEWTRSTMIAYATGHQTHTVSPWSAGDRDGRPPDPRSSSPDGPPRVFRGGSWLSDAGGLRSAYRLSDHPWSRDGDVGFRLVVRSPALFGA